MKQDINYWLGISNAWEKSGLSQKPFCKNQGVNYGQLSQWRSVLIEKGLVGRRDHRKVLKSVAKKMNKSADFTAISLPLATPQSDPDPIQVGEERSKTDHGHMINVQNDGSAAGRIEINLPFGVTLSMPAHVCV